MSGVRARFVSVAFVPLRPLLVRSACFVIAKVACARSTSSTVGAYSGLVPGEATTGGPGKRRLAASPSRATPWRALCSSKPQGTPSRRPLVLDVDE